MGLYSAVLAVGLVLSAPWWLLRMLTTEKYREGLGERLGRVSGALLGVVTGKRVVWVHAVSVGEVLAATRLVEELEVALGVGWVVVISTTTKTGQALAKDRFGAERVFYYPLDFAWAVRAYLRVLRPAAVVLMESEVWPRMLWECRRGGVPVVVANARVSDRSFRRALKVTGLWRWLTRGVDLWLAQSSQDATRLIWLGIEAYKVREVGNLKFDISTSRENDMAQVIETAASGRQILVAGSTLEAEGIDEELLVIEAWKGRVRTEHKMMLVLAPRHPERFEKVFAMAEKYGAVRATQLVAMAERGTPFGVPEIVILNTIGDLAGVYRVATIAFVGGSMVSKGGHNPLEAAQFGVPIIIGSSWENFTDIVYRLSAAGGIAVLAQAFHLEGKLLILLLQPEHMFEMGKQARAVFEEQQGATGRAVEAIVAVMAGGWK